MSRKLGAPQKVYAQGACLFEPRLAEFGDVDTAMIVLEMSRGALCHGTTVIRQGLHQNWFDRVAPTYAAQLAAFIDAFESRDGTFPNVQDGLLAESTAEAAQKSMETGLRVDIPFEGDDGM